VRAALLVEPGRIVVDEVPDPAAGPGDVVIGVGGVGLCGSDLSVFSGKWSTPSSPWIMGHEAFGRIVDVGAGVSAERIGETVVVEPNVACFTCDQCQRGWTSACQSRQSVGMNRPGALAELLVVPAGFAWRIDAQDPADLVCAEPTTVVLAALRRLGSTPPSSALVVGVGAQGLLMTLVLADRGTEVRVADVNRDRVSFATEVGGHPLEDERRRFDLVVDTVGSPASVALSMERVEFGGTVLFLGLDARPLELTAQMIVRRQAVLRGSLTYDHPRDFAESVEAIGAGRLRPGRIVSESFALAEAQAAFAGAPQAAGKTWIRVAEPEENS
jgi:alcohol dehydrogenase/L-iditol 2-dehydrogenase